MKKLVAWALLAAGLLGVMGGLSGCQKSGGEEEPEETIYVYDAGEFTTNVQGDRGVVLRTALKIDVTRESLLVTLEERGYVAQNAIVYQLRQLTEETVKQQDIQVTLGASIRDALNEAFETDAFEGVYFSQFVYS
ncbi:MAG: flagellar basal body-associated FliL family protein [Oscillospiraceae bacterium]|jgi:flagellar basal body-associated protein FliL|nr:flagellar basal body-associated FliL family protein [Oscillospiraceae bacterium]